MTTLDQVRDGLEIRLKTISGLRVYDYRPDDVNYPAAVIFPPINADYRDDQGMGSWSVQFIVMLMVPSAIDRKQLDLYAFLDRTGSSSIFAAIEADRTLGGLSVDCRVSSALDPLDMAVMAGTSVYQRAVLVDVIIS